MKPSQLAQILLRIVAILIVWRVIEFGISQYVGFQYQMKIYTPMTDEPALEIFRSVQLLILFSAVVPITLAAILWFLSPKLSRLIVSEDQGGSQVAFPTISALTLLQVAAFVFIAVAVANLPQIIYSFSTDRLRDPTTTVMISRAFPDALQFTGKVLVGGIILLVIKEKTKKQEAEQVGDGDAEEAV